jgi:hypothetical protein
LAQAEEEHGFLDVVNPGREAEVDGIHHAQQAGGERRIAADDLGDLRVHALLRAHEFAQGAVDALERGEFWAGFDPSGDLFVAIATGG